MGEELGVSTRKEENFSQWYLEVVRKGGFADQRTPVKGCDVFMPWGFGIWENIQSIADPMFKERGVKNAYFPLFIPKSLLEKEAEHFEGFVPEVAWVTRGGDRELDEWLAIRPTSETIMYYTFSKWISSYRDLPLRINQWVNVVRWETKATKPFLRSREFLWQEGHTVHASWEEAKREVDEMIEVYSKIFDEYLALPFLILKRTENDKFAGADFTVAFDTFVPEAGRVLQLGTVHHLGQNFSKPFEITFKDRDQKVKYAYQTSWGFSTRLIGAVIAVHGDDRGAVIPPRVAPVQVVIVPILFKGKEEPVLKAARELLEKLKEIGVRVELDDREDKTPGWKFNEWELKGVPLRIEVGPRDVEKGGFTVVRRDTGEKRFEAEVERVPELLEEIQRSLRERAWKRLEESIVVVEDLEGVKRAVEEKKIAKTYWCGRDECEFGVKEEIGAEIRGTRYDVDESEEAKNKKCFFCGREAKFTVYIAKSW
ncbi:MAG: proline--tRNA ligase [Candidatus Diapherotrites archaeon]|nr:proline--tRNA ligase [Candidatus Diapherotrites archaeon]